VGRSLTLDDIGLELKDSAKYFTLSSREVLLKESVIRIGNEVAAGRKLQQQPVFTYLANEISVNGRSIPYSTITALKFPIPAVFGFLNATDGKSITPLRENDIVLNEWAAKELNARPGDRVRVRYFVAGAGNQLLTEEHEFTLKSISPMEGLGIDRDLAPDYPGIQEAQHISDWSPPFPVDLSKIRPVDERYWDEYRAAPKAFIALDAGKKLWKSRFGSLTSIRLAPKGEKDSFQKGFLQKANPAELGFSFQPVKRQGLNAASGSTDFGGLFIGFSLFLIISAALLVALLFRLGVELRAKELGILLSVGYSVKTVRRRFLAEGILLSACGALLGLAGAMFYAWLLLKALKTWWVAAIGSPFLSLHMNPQSLLIGFFLSLIIVIFSIARSVSRLSRVPPPMLLNGVTTSEQMVESRKYWRWLGIFLLLVVVILFSYGILAGKTSSPELFFLIGSFCLVIGLIFFSVWLRKPTRNPITVQGSSVLLRLAIRNSVRNPGRSLLSAALVCCACFVIVAVSANRVLPQKDAGKLNSGTGGYSLVAESDVPIPLDLDHRDAQRTLGIPDSTRKKSNLKFTSFRLLPGDDVSCLNLYKPQNPRILGVPENQISRGGFLFSDSLATTSQERANPWLLLDSNPGEGIVPAIGDANSVKWILHLGLGKDVTITDGLGRPLRLRIVALLTKSIFQSELLISSKNFLSHFPAQNGFSYFLIQTVPSEESESATLLENALSDYGFDAASTAEKLAGYQAVENTYLSTFETLGGLGLLLGTVGLGIILVRNVLERRGEFATLRAFGYRRSTLAILVLIENGVLLLTGIAIGTLSAWIAVTPHILVAGSEVPWQSLFVTLLLVFLTGMLASIGATSLALRVPLLPALKAE
jgi:ABC-type antimicrobial peptide transport system permease subunit